MWKHRKHDDLDDEEEEWDPSEYEDEEEDEEYEDYEDEDEDDEDEDDYEDEDEGSSRLKFLIIGLIIAIVIVGVLFVFLGKRSRRAPKEEPSSVVVATDYSSDMPSGSDAVPEVADDMNGDMNADMNGMTDMNPADGMSMDDMGMEETDMNAGQAPTAVSAPAPTPAAAASAIPEKYKIPGVEDGDLTAVHEYIQKQLDAIAADVNCPNIDSLKANDDCTVFTALVNSVDESVTEAAAVEKIYEFGRMYAAHAGKTVNKIRIDYTNFWGDLLWSRESKEAAQPAEEVQPANAAAGAAQTATGTTAAQGGTTQTAQQTP